MPRKIHCEKCTTALNIPDHVTAGKRLKCPKCEFKFVLTFQDASSESTFAGPIDADTASQLALPTHYAPPPSSDGLAVPAGRHTPAQGMPVHSGPLSPMDGIPVARSAGDLRDTFDLPLSDARSMERGQASDGGMADAAALLQERPLASRRVSAADARATARRCTRCGSGIPKGMSLCATCGLDQETGQLIDFNDDLMPQAAPRPTAPPVHVSIIGGITAVASLILTIASFVQSSRTDNPYFHYGWLIVAAAAGFACYGAVQFIRGKSARVLLLGLTLGVIIDIFCLVIMPIAYTQIGDFTFQPTLDANELDTPGVGIIPAHEVLDLGRIKLGVTLAVGYAIASMYLMSNLVKKYIQSRVPRHDF